MAGFRESIKTHAETGSTVLCESMCVCVRERERERERERQISPLKQSRFPLRGEMLVQRGEAP